MKPTNPYLTLRGIAFFALLTLSAAAQSQTYIGSWNAKHLGQGNDVRDWPRTAQVIKAYDFIAIQEVHGTEAITRLEKMLEKRTGEEWSSLTSDSGVGRTRYKERYAFMWREKKIAYMGGAVTYLDIGDKFEREPFSARFATRDGKHYWTAANIHIIYGKKKSQREEEVRELSKYVDWLIAEASEGYPVLVMGDFNLKPTNPAWEALGDKVYPLIVKGKTTLSVRDRSYSSLYDNILTDGRLPIAGVFIDEYPVRVKMEHATARKKVSDHAPVGLILP